MTGVLIKMENLEAHMYTGIPCKDEGRDGVMLLQGTSSTASNHQKLGERCGTDPPS